MCRWVESAEQILLVSEDDIGQNISAPQAAAQELQLWTVPSPPPLSEAYFRGQNNDQSHL